MSRTRNWCFTVFTHEDGSHENHWDPETFAWESTKPATKYIIAGLEVCPETKRLHWQGYIELHNPASLVSAKNALGTDRCHLEVRRGSRLQAVAYCKKLDTAALPEAEATDDYQEIAALEKTIFEWGQTESENNDDVYDEVLHAENYSRALEIVKRKRPRDFVLYGASVERNLGVHYSKPTKYTRGDRRYNLPYFGDGTMESKSILLLGKAGTGKTRFALDHFENPLLVRHTDALKRLKLDSTYDGIVFDDFTVNHWPATSVIHLVDLELEAQINVKHGIICIPNNMKRIFTSNLCMDEWMPATCNDEQRNAIRRRCLVKLINTDIRLFE